MAGWLVCRRRRSREPRRGDSRCVGPRAHVARQQRVGGRRCVVVRVWCASVELCGARHTTRPWLLQGQAWQA